MSSHPKVAMLQAPDLRECMFASDDGFVKHCLSYLVHLDETRTDEQKESILWPALHIDTVAKSGLRWGKLAKHPRTLKSKFFKCFPQRMKEVVCFAEANPDYPKKKELACDPSQNMHRFALGEIVDGKLITPCIIPNGWTWVGDVDRCQAGGEQLAFQGFPVRAYKDQLLTMEEPEIRSLSGNAFPGTIVASAIDALFAAVDLKPHPTRPATTSSSSHGDAHALFTESLNVTAAGSSSEEGG